MDKGIISHKNTHFVDRKGNDVGYYRTKGGAKRIYIQDYFADLAKRLYCNPNFKENEQRENTQGKVSNGKVSEASDTDTADKQP